MIILAVGIGEIVFKVRGYSKAKCTFCGGSICGAKAELFV